MTTVDTLVLFSRILNEEAGNGNAGRCHEVLMENAHNLYGQVEFGWRRCASRRRGTASWSSRRRSSTGGAPSNCSGTSYHRMLGVAMALESHADRMLQVCRTAFRNSNNELSKDRFVDNVEIYFNVHVGDEGVEERHAADAKQCVLNNCHSDADVAEIAHGAKETLKIQLDMWNAMEKVTHGLNA